MSFRAKSTYWTEETQTQDTKNQMRINRIQFAADWCFIRSYFFRSSDKKTWNDKVIGFFSDTLFELGIGHNSLSKDQFIVHRFLSSLLLAPVGMVIFHSRLQ